MGLSVRRLELARPGVPEVACFDTAFPCTVPDVAQLFALPSRYAEAGRALEMEVTVEHRRRRARSTVRSLPYFNPERKRQ